MKNNSLSLKVILVAIFCNFIAYVLFVFIKGDDSTMMFFGGLIKNLPGSIIYLLPFLIVPLVVQLPFSYVFGRLNSLGKIVAVIVFLILNVCLTYVCYGASNFDGLVVVFRILSDLLLIGFLFQKGRPLQN
ncbi:hypothetical protein ACTJIJ_20310 [Niabella sp. 22666]|uniref:hypothetical protein n=1 Tax=Niabella sp. 22666 TaxID=3453954 RepID=UPI003F85DA20